MNTNPPPEDDEPDDPDATPLVEGDDPDEYIDTDKAKHASQMSWQEAHRRMTSLWKKWGTSRPEEMDIDKLQSFILRELRAAIAGKIKCSPGLIREMKGELVLCGKIRKALK